MVESAKSNQLQTVTYSYEDFLFAVKICGCKATLRCIGILFNLKSRFVTKLKISTSAVRRSYRKTLTVLPIKQRTGFISWMVIFKLFWMQTRKYFIKAYWTYSKLSTGDIQLVDPNSVLEAITYNSLYTKTLVKTKHTTHDDKQYPFVDDLLPEKLTKNCLHGDTEYKGSTNTNN